MLEQGILAYQSKWEKKGKEKEGRGAGKKNQVGCSLGLGLLGRRNYGGAQCQEIKGGEALALAGELPRSGRMFAKMCPDITLASALAVHDAADDSAIVCI